MTTELDTFETRLLAELREHVATSPVSVATRRTTPRWVVGGVAAAAAAIVGVLLVPGLGTTPAYSVQEGNAGEIEVEVNRLEDAAGLEAALAEHGVHADVRYLPWGQECAPGRYTAVDRSLSGMSVSSGSSTLEVVLPPGAVRDGETFVMWVSGREMTPEEMASISADEGHEVSQGFHSSVELDVAAGPVGPCEVVPADG
jgi:hypothetical protein